MGRSPADCRSLGDDNHRADHLKGTFHMLLQNPLQVAAENQFAGRNDPSGATEPIREQKR